MVHKVVGLVRMYIIVAGLTALVVCSSMMVATPVAKAATMEEMQTQMAALMAQITALQSQIHAAQGMGSSTAGTVPHRPLEGAEGSTTLHIGTKVQTTEPLRIRSAAGLQAAFIATQPAGVEGVIVEGPVMLDGYRWFKVDYVTGADGWNVGFILKSKMQNEAGAWMHPPRTGESSSTMPMVKPRASSTVDGIRLPRASSTAEMPPRRGLPVRNEMNSRPASTSGSVLGASTDVFSEISVTLDTISTLLRSVN